MIRRLVVITLFFLSLCATCFAQTSFQGLTAGTSTRSDVARVLGQPVRAISATLFEYNPPVGIAKVEVAYAAGSSLVERIEVYFIKPITRQALIQKLGLSPRADAQTKNAEGKLVELFGGSSFVTLVYAATDTSSGVSRIGYYSRELFGSTLAKVRGPRQNPEVQSGSSRNASGLAMPELPGYMRGPSEPTPSGTEYEGLMPGRSTRADVERRLGQPVKEHSQTLVEYKPDQPTQSKIYVEYKRGPLVIQRIEITLTQPHTRSDVLARLHLPEHSTARRVNASGNMEEHFGPPFYVVLTYQGLSNSVIRTERYSRELFESALSKKSPDAGGAGSDSLQLTPTDTPQIQLKNPYDKEKLLTVVRLNALSSQEITEAIEQRGVDFQMTPQVEAEFRRVGASQEVINAIRANYQAPVFTSNPTVTVSRSSPPSSSRQPSCFAADVGAANTSRSAHYEWAKQQDSTRLDRNLRDKLALLFQCPTVSDDRLASAFANVSVLVAHYVPNANCFDGNRGVVSTDASVHRDWARARSRQEVLNNLQSKVSAAMKCLDRNRQLDFFADVSVIIATSG